MLKQERKTDQTISTKDHSDEETELFIIETDFIVQEIGLSSNIPHEIDALALVSDETSILTLVLNPENVEESIRKIDELGIGITTASFNPDLFREKAVSSQD